MSDSRLLEQFANFSEAEISFFAKEAAKNGMIKEFKFLFIHPKLKPLADNPSTRNESFIISCKNGQLEIVKFLLTSPHLNERVDIHFDDDNGLQLACLAGKLDIVKYLLTSSELKEKANLHASTDNPFKFAASQEHMDVIHFLIVEMDIEFSPHIDIYLDKIQNNEIRNMFKLRQLNKDLNNNLTIKNISKKKNKL